MGFFGITVKKKRRNVVSIPAGNGLQLCGSALANLDKLVPTGYTCLYAGIRSEKYVLCNLSAANPQCSLNHSFFPDDTPVEFSVEGKGEIHLTGFWDLNENSDQSCSEDSNLSEVELEDEVPVAKAEKSKTAPPEQCKKRKIEEMSYKETVNNEQAKDSMAERQIVGAEKSAAQFAQPNAVAMGNSPGESARSPQSSGATEKKKKKKKNKSMAGVTEAESDDKDLLKVPGSIKGRYIEGMKVQDIVLGSGKFANKGQKIGILYEVSSPSGEVYDKNWNDRKPLNFRIGSGEVITGVEKGVQGMKVHGERILTIPPELGYGAKGAGPIKPNSTLVFHLKLVSVG